MGVDYRWRDRLRLRDSLDLLNAALLAVSFALYLVNEHVLKSLTPNAFFQGHFNDFLAVWIFLPYCNLLLAFYPHKRVRISTLPACVAVSAVSGLGWEYVAPLYLDNSVSDPIDLLMYVLSGVLYAILIAIIKKRRL